MKRVFLDMDGVIVNWMDAAIKSCYLEVTPEIRAGLKNGNFIDVYVPNSWDYINPHGERWWEDLEPLPWAEELYRKLTEVIDVCILTSPGDPNKNLMTVTNASVGKARWLAKHFPGCHTMMGRSKHFCASPQSLLVDDYDRNIMSFIAWGGRSFLWPNQYKFFDGDISVTEVIDNLLNCVSEL